MLFAKLLRVQESQIIRHTQSLAAERSGYFREVTHRGDLFLDPDTGIATGKVTDASQYLFAGELHELLAGGPERVIAVYQHIRGQRTRERLKKVVSALELRDRPFSCCSYESGTVAMLFLSLNDGRIDGIYREFESLLGPRAAQRVYRWRHLQDSKPSAIADGEHR